MTVSTNHLSDMAAATRGRCSMSTLFKLTPHNFQPLVVSRWTPQVTCSSYIFSLLSQTSTMPPKRKAKKNSCTTKDVTPREGSSNWPVRASLCLLFSSTYGEEPSDHNRIETHRVETEINCNAVMDMLVDISSHLSATEHFMNGVRACKDTGVAQRNHSLSCTPTTPGTSRGHTCRYVANSR